jgi:large subunit ribosomal protein L10
VIDLAITRKKKQTMVDKYVTLLSDAKAVLITEYRGMTVADITRLRRQIEQSGASYVVVKNTLFKRALEQVGLPVPEELLTGPVAVGIVPKDPAAASKTLAEFGVTNELLVIKGGLLGNRQMNKAQLTSLATLPSREVLLAQVLAGMQSPITGLVRVLNGPIRGLVYVLQARSDQLAGPADTAAEGTAVAAAGA